MDTTTTTEQPRFDLTMSARPTSIDFSPVINRVSPLVMSTLPRYLGECAAIGNGKASIDSKRNAITRFAATCGTMHPLASEIEAWIADMKTNYIPATQHLHLILVRGFFRWAVRVGVILDDPFEVHQIAFKPKSHNSARAKQTLPFSTHEIARMRQAVEDLERFGFKGRKSTWITEHRLVFLLSLTTGMRLGEVVEIRLSQFEMRDSVMWLNVAKAKWSAQGRYVRIESETAAALREYVPMTTGERDRPTTDGIADWLFPAKSRGSARNRIAGRVRDIMDLAETKHDSKGRRRQLLHAFRKTVISTAAAHGATSGEVESAFGVSAAVARKYYIDPTLNASHDRASAAAVSLVAAANTPLARFNVDIWSPFSGAEDRIPEDQRKVDEIRRMEQEIEELQERLEIRRLAAQ